MEDNNKKVRKENDDLNKRYLELKEKFDKLEKDNLELNKLLENKEKELENKDNLINHKQKEKEELIKKIYELKEKLSRYPLDLSKGENLISVIFTSSDQNIHYSIICKNTEKFSKLEQKLYKKYPEYSKSDNYFLVNGSRIKKYKTLNENKIKNSEIIILKQNKF